MAIIERGNEYIDTQAEARQAAWDKRFPTDEQYYSELHDWAISEYLNGSESSREATIDSFVDDLCNNITPKAMDDVVRFHTSLEFRDLFINHLCQISEDAFREACCDE